MCKQKVKKRGVVSTCHERLLVSIYCRQMQFDVSIRLYEYWHEQVKIKKKRWNNKEIKKFYWK
jgi:hypothetical protein